MDKRQLLEVVWAFASGRRPYLPGHSVCMDCKRRGTVCLLVAQGTPCMGPVTRTGCNALCPSYGRGCFGCFGPIKPVVNMDSLGAVLRARGHGDREITRLFRSFTAGAEPFRKASEFHERELGERVP